jgi:hypothetical protein
MENNNYISFKKRILTSIMSLFIGMFIGIIISQIIGNSLIIISLNKFFSIIFGICFILLGIILFWRIYTNIVELSKKYIFIFFSFIVFISGIFCFILEKKWIYISITGKVSLYGIIGISLSFSLVFALVELINFGIFNKICFINSKESIFKTKIQIYFLFSGTIIMGSIFGILFGTIDIEDDNIKHNNKLKENLIWSIPIGAFLGGILGFINQWIRTQPQIYYSLITTSTSYQTM